MALLLIGLACLAGCIVLGFLIFAGEVAPVVEPAPQEEGAAADASRAAKARAPQIPPVMERLHLLAVRISPASVVGKVQKKLEFAGNPPGWTVDRIMGFKGLGLIVMAVLGLLEGIGQGLLAVVLPVGGAYFGFHIPDLLLSRAGDRRQTRIQKGVPDAIDMLTVCVEAGLGFDAALAQVARNSEGPIAAECARVLQEMQFGKSRSEALRALTERTTVRELRTFVSALVQASELGIPVANVLREQAKEMRLRSRQLAEEKAQKVPVKILFPVVFCLLPSMFAVVLGPGIMQLGQAFK